MKYVLTEQQNERIMKIIKSVADTYTTERIVKTDVEVESANDDSGDTYYVLYPIFYVNLEQFNDRKIKNHIIRFSKHELADFVETMVGVPVHSYPARIKTI
jgi:hypothetical protein